MNKAFLMIVVCMNSIAMMEPKVKSEAMRLVDDLVYNEGDYWKRYTDKTFNADKMDLIARAQFNGKHIGNNFFENIMVLGQALDVIANTDVKFRKSETLTPSLMVSGWIPKFEGVGEQSLGSMGGMRLDQVYTLVLNGFMKPKNSVQMIFSTISNIEKTGLCNISWDNTTKNLSYKGSIKDMPKIKAILNNPEENFITNDNIAYFVLFVSTLYATQVEVTEKNEETIKQSLLEANSLVKVSCFRAIFENYVRKHAKEKLKTEVKNASLEVLKALMNDVNEIMVNVEKIWVYKHLSDYVKKAFAVLDVTKHVNTSNVEALREIFEQGNWLEIQESPSVPQMTEQKPFTWKQKAAVFGAIGIPIAIFIYFAYKKKLWQKLPFKR